MSCKLWAFCGKIVAQGRNFKRKRSKARLLQTDKPTRSGQRLLPGNVRGRGTTPGGRPAGKLLWIAQAPNWLKLRRYPASRVFENGMPEDGRLVPRFSLPSFMRPSMASSTPRAFGIVATGTSGRDRGGCSGRRIRRPGWSCHTETARTGSLRAGTADGAHRLGLPVARA